MENKPPDFGPRKKVAKTFAQRLIKDVGFTQAPISLYRIIGHLQATRALDIRRVNLTDKVSGLLVVCREVDEEFATIGFNVNHSWYRRRFTIAHEIGHLLLSHTCTKDQEDGSYNETEANVFAAELLMPTAFIKIDFKSTPNLPDLCKLYRVSDQALAIKLMEARLL